MIFNFSKFINNKIVQYIILILIALIIYYFQLEKNFNLLPIYIISVIFSIVSTSYPSKSKYLLPVFFIIGLCTMYHSIMAFYIILAIVYFLLILLIDYNLILKKLLFYTSLFCLACIYLIKNPIMDSYSIIPYVVGSLFLFRSIIYLYELKIQKKPIDLIHRINYFLLLPNLSLPLFPIVDLKAFGSSYQKIDNHLLERAILFIIRGIFQLLLYRFIYHILIIPISDIHNLYDLVYFVILSFLLILRVIGAFHIALGMIMLTGYNVPDLFNNIFFATSFSDLWRRTNMYWKAFMIKIFYYPIYFKIKKWGAYSSIFISTISCFFITWILHSYQWFLIKGNFPFFLKDLIFWGSFGILVSYNSINQQKALDNNSQKNNTKNSIFLTTLKSLGVFLIMSFLWSIWVASTLESWISLLKFSSNFDFLILFKTISLLCFYLIIAYCYHFYIHNKSTIFKVIEKNQKNISIILFFTFIIPILFFQLNHSNNKSINKVIKSLALERLNNADKKNIDNGYYSNLISSNDFTSQIWDNQNDNSKRWTKYTNSKLVDYTKNILIGKYKPNTSIDFQGVHYSINSIGIHDKEYPFVKPANTYRIIALGGSYETGNSINDNEDFISLVETNLNSKNINFGNMKNTEIINFSVNGYMPLQRYFQYKWNARKYKPDAVLLFLHTNYQYRMVNYIYRLLKDTCTIEDPYLQNLIIKHNITIADNDVQITKKLGTDVDSLIDYSIKGIASIANEDSTKVIAVFLPALKDKKTPQEYSYIKALCNKYNIELINLSTVYATMDKDNLSISETDFHPNKIANDLIAKNLFDSIVIHQNYFNFDTIK